MDDTKHEIFRRIREQRELFDAAIGILIEKDATRAEWIGATRAIVWTLFWGPSEFEESDAPRVSDVRRRLERVEMQSRQLRASLERLSDVLGPYSAALFGPRVADIPFWQQSNISDFVGTNLDPDLNDSTTYRRLQNIEAACAKILERLLPDRGGDRRIGRMAYGNPKWRLVNNAAMTFGEFRRNDFTTSANGPFYAFCAALYGVITGRDPEAHGVGLRRYVDFAVPKYQELGWLLGEYDCVHSVIRVRGPSAARTAELDGIRAKMNAIHDVLKAGPPSRKSKPVHGPSYGASDE